MAWSCIRLGSIVNTWHPTALGLYILEFSVKATLPHNFECEALELLLGVLTASLAVSYALLTAKEPVIKELSRLREDI